MIKRWIAVLIIMAFSIVTISGTAADNEAAEHLKRMGIVDEVRDGTFDIEAPMTRADFCVLMVRELDLEKIVDGLQAYEFEDTKSHPAKNYINLLRNLGIVKGDENNYFFPDDNITYIQAIKIVLDSLGYYSIAQEYGGYETGYIRAAHLTGLLEGMPELGAQEVPSCAVLAQLLYRALNTKLAKTDFSGNVYISEETLLAGTLSGGENSGFVTANDVTDLYQEDGAVKSGYVRISTPEYGEEIYYAGTTDAGQLLGYQVRFIYSYDTVKNEKVILSVEKDLRKNRTYHFDSRDIHSDTTRESLVIEDENGQKTYQIEAGASVIYNGKLIPYQEISGKDFQVENGTVTMNDSDGNGRYDVIFVTEYKSGLVSSVDPESNKIYFKSNNSGLGALELIQDIDSSNRIYKEHKEISISEIEPNDILTAAVSRDGRCVMGYVTNEKVSGTVNAIWADRQEVKINEETYRCLPGLSPALKAGDKVICYLDVRGNIMYYTQEAERDSYAYLIDAKLEDGLSDRVLLRALDEYGEVREFSTEGRIRLNDQTARAADAVNTIRGHIKEVIKYAVNSSGSVTKIDTAARPNEKGYNDEAFSLDKSGIMGYKEGMPSILGMEYALTDNTIVFYVPESETDPLKYKTTDRSLLSNNRQYDVDIYDATQTRKANVVVYKADRSADERLAYTDTPTMISQIVTTLDEDGLPCTMVCGMREGKEIEVLLAESNSPLLDGDLLENPEDITSKRFSQLKSGDVIQYKVDVEGKLDEFRVLYQYGDGFFDKLWDTKQELYTIYGEVAEMDDEVVIVSKNRGETFRVFGLDNLQVYRFDSRRQSVEVADSHELVPFSVSLDCSRVFVRVKNGIASDIFIID